MKNTDEPQKSIRGGIEQSFGLLARDGQDDGTIGVTGKSAEPKGAERMVGSTTY